MLANINKPIAALKGIIGGVIGMGISYVINSTLAEISINPFFSAVRFTQYFGILFSVVGGSMVWRIQNNQKEDYRKKYYLIFGCLVVFSGLICFILEKDWFVRLSALTKTPFYAILGTSLSFSLAFATVDMLNYFKFFYDPENNTSIIDNQDQILSVLSLSIVSGLVYGFLFGTLDIEDANMYQMHVLLLREELYCYPIGLITGITAGVLIEKYKDQQKKPSSMFEEEI